MTTPSFSLCGLMGSGKTSVSHTLASADNNIRVFSYANEIKKSTFERYPFLKDRSKIEQRPFVQKIGAYYRSLDSQYWIKKMATAIEQERSMYPNCNAIIDDVRLDSEAEWCNQNGFPVIELVSENSVRLERLRRRDGGVDLKALQDVTETKLPRHLIFASIDTTNLRIEQVIQEILSQLGCLIKS